MTTEPRQNILQELKSLLASKPGKFDGDKFWNLMNQLHAEGGTDPSRVQQELAALDGGGQAEAIDTIRAQGIKGFLQNNRALMVAIIALLLVLVSIVTMGIILTGYQRANVRIFNELDKLNMQVSELATIVHNQASTPIPPTSSPPPTPVPPTIAPTEPTVPPSPTTPPIANWVFTGHVFKKDSQEGIENITVHLKQFDGQQCLEPDLNLATSDATGNFKLQADLPSPLRVCIQADPGDLWNVIANTEHVQGWDRGEDNQLISPELTDASREIGGNIFYLEIRRTFSGKVIDEQDNGLKTTVSLSWKAEEKEDWKPFGEPVQTDESGAFKIEWDGVLKEAFYKLEQKPLEGYVTKEITPFGVGTWIHKDGVIESSVRVADPIFEGAVFKNVKQPPPPTKPAPTTTKTAPTGVPPTVEPKFGDITLPSDREVTVFSDSALGATAWAKFLKAKTISIMNLEKDPNSMRVKVRIKLYVKRDVIVDRSRVPKGATLYWPSGAEVGNVPSGGGTSELVIQQIEIDDADSRIVVEGWIAKLDLPN